jgi:hypothetical protein
MLAVISRNQFDRPALQVRLAGLSTQARVAIGASRATVSGHLVDGPALDVEGWAPYPLPPGVWVQDGL